VFQISVLFLFIRLALRRLASRNTSEKCPPNLIFVLSFIILQEGAQMLNAYGPKTTCINLYVWAPGS